MIPNIAEFHGFMRNYYMKTALLCFTLGAFIFAGNANAEVRYILPKEKSNLSGQDVNIHFSGTVNQTKIVDLESAIDKFNIDFPEAKAIISTAPAAGGIQHGQAMPQSKARRYPLGQST
jgi:hypothetical protein